MSENQSRGRQPLDAEKHVITRAMGVPIASQKKLGSAAYRDIFDLKSYGERVFHGIAVYNPDVTNSIYIAIGANNAGASQRCIIVHPNGFLAFDHQTFGYGWLDPITAIKSTKLRALLSATSGTLATGTIGYAAANPTNGMTVTIDGNVYEFSNDQSVAPGRIKVDIGASADLTYTALVTAVNAADFNVTASVNTGTDIFTVTSNFGGTDGNAQTFLDGGDGGTVTGATFSGAGTLTGGLNGLTPNIHIW